MDENHTLKVEISQKENSRFCAVCQREFSSGKALGGHMRVHSQDSSFRHNSNNGDGLDCSFFDESIKINFSDGETADCSVCGKLFNSLKSLYGHMRSHPGRRGFHQEEGQVESDSLSESDPVIGFAPEQGLLGLLPRWGITGKRGRGETFPAVDQEVLEAARDLMSLAGGSHSWIVTEDCFDKKQRTSELNGTASSSDKICFVLQSDQKSGFGSDCESKLNGNGQLFAEPGKSKEKKKKKRVDDPIDSQKLQPADTNPIPGREKFPCVTCGKEFSSYQALGGHRSKHYKERNNNPGPGTENGSTQEKTVRFVGPTLASWTRHVAEPGQPVGGISLVVDLNLPPAAPPATDEYDVMLSQ